MQATRTPVRMSRWHPWLALPSAVLGACMGLFLYGYWLRDVLTLGDEQMLMLTATVGILGTAGYFFLLNWTFPRMAALASGARYGLTLASVPVAAFFLFGGTSNWISSNRYLDFLLPEHHLELTATPVDAAPGSALVWFNTSLGDVSYGTIESRGWKRVGDELIIQDSASNALSWTGDVGDRVQMVFSGPASDVNMLLSWDGSVETVVLSKGKTNYSRAFSVPFYASETAIMAVGFLSFYGPVLALSVLLWKSRSRLADAVLQSMSGSHAAFVALDMWLLIGAAVVAVVLRAFNLGAAFPAVDEYYHLIAAKQIVEGAGLNAVYQRGLWIVTLPVALALRVFGDQLWAARLVGVVFNVLALVPLYLIARKINRPIAVLACLLYAASPWIITFARVAREYAYYPFYFFWIILAMLEFIDGIPQGFVFRREWKVLLQPRMLALAGALLLPPVFALKIDWLSTFRTILIAYLVLGLFILLRFNWRDKSNWPFLALVGAGVLLSGRSWYLEQSSKMLILPQLNTLPIEYFLPNPQQQWYLDRVVIMITGGIIAALGAGLLLRRLNFIPLFVFTLFGSYLAIFALFSRTFFHTRHLLSTELWYVIVVAMGLYVSWRALTLLIPHMGKSAQVLVAAAVGLSITNLGQIVLPTFSTNPDMPISEDYMHDMSPVQAFMLGNARPGEVLISTVYGQYAIWEGNPTFAGQFHITSHTPVADILTFATQYPAGWIVVDEIRFKLASMSIKDLAGHDQIEYVGLYGDEHVWHWQRSSASAGELSSAGGGR